MKFLFFQRLFPLFLAIGCFVTFAFLIGSLSATTWIRKRPMKSEEWAINFYGIAVDDGYKDYYQHFGLIRMTAIPCKDDETIKDYQDNTYKGSSCSFTSSSFSYSMDLYHKYHDYFAEFQDGDDTDIMAVDKDGTNLDYGDNKKFSDKMILFAVALPTAAGFGFVAAFIMFAVVYVMFGYSLRKVPIPHLWVPILLAFGIICCIVTLTLTDKARVTGEYKVIPNDSDGSTTYYYDFKDVYSLDASWGVFMAGTVGYCACFVLSIFAHIQAKKAGKSMERL